MSVTLNPRKFLKFALLAAIINSVIFLVAKSADAAMAVKQAPIKEIVLPVVFASTLFALIVAAYAVGFIAKKSPGFALKAPVIGLLFGVITAAAPFTATDDSKTAIALALNHVVAGMLWFFGAKRALNSAN